MPRSRALLVGLAMVAGAAAPVFGPAAPLAAVRAQSPWVRPVDGRVVRPFIAPRTPYGPGHRGVDLAAAPGTDVVAAGPGVVVFAGRIGPSSHVVVLHQPSGWRTGYSFLASVTVHRGQSVVAGTSVGASGGTSVGSAEGHDGTVLHFSLRIGERYVDPMILFRPLDLGAVVHLDRIRTGNVSGAPGGVAPAASERASLLAGLRHRAGPPYSGTPEADVLQAQLGRASAQEVGAALKRVAAALAHERWR